MKKNPQKYVRNEYFDLWSIFYIHCYSKKPMHVLSLLHIIRCDFRQINTVIKMLVINVQSVRILMHFAAHFIHLLNFTNSLTTIDG